MKSIKPGRGRSRLSGYMGFIASIWALIWTFAAVSLGAPIFFPIFGLLFLIVTVIHTIYHFRNASGKNRYSVYDVVDSAEEPDPLDISVRPEVPSSHQDGPATGSRYCPYCGARAEKSFAYCSQCGRQLP